MLCVETIFQCQNRDCLTTGELVSLFCNQWNEMMNATIAWESRSNNGYHEANYLKLGCSRISKVCDWRPKWNTKIADQKIIEWNREYLYGGSLSECMDEQIHEYLNRSM